MTATYAGSLADNTARIGELLDRSWHLSIGGTTTAAASGEVFRVVSPVTREPIAEVPNGGVEDVDRAVASAKKAFPLWRSQPATVRADFVVRLADAIEARARDLALLDVIDGGAPVRVMAGDVAAAGVLLRYCAGLALEVKGTSVPASTNVHFTEREPYGVVVRIIPYNHPFLFAAAKIAAPLVAGNTVVLKPPEVAPLSALVLGEIANEVLPAGVLNVVVGDGPGVPTALVAHPDVRRIGFIGSAPTGQKVLQTAAAHGIKEVSLEMGGKNALIAFPDADPDEVARGAVAGMNFTWSGQSCGSTSRLLVHDSIADRVSEAIVALLRNHVVGDPRDPETDQGVIVSERQYDKIAGMIATARADGARVLTGGGCPEHLRPGWYIEPTVLDNVAPDSQIAQDEVFGPVLSVLRWDDPARAVEIANSVKYGLTGAVYTSDVRQAHKVARELETGFVWINGAGPHFMGMPFGGYKSSGIGREESLDELLSFTQLKSINIFLD
jgi:acyl-CoA reductase-like NAD-dependent aldehyde dehydrogenase